MWKREKIRHRKNVFLFFRFFDFFEQETPTLSHNSLFSLFQVKSTQKEEKYLKFFSKFIIKFIIKSIYQIVWSKSRKRFGVVFELKKSYHSKIMAKWSFDTLEWWRWMNWISMVLSDQLSLVFSRYVSDSDKNTERHLIGCWLNGKRFGWLESMTSNQHPRG